MCIRDSNLFLAETQGKAHGGGFHGGVYHVPAVGWNIRMHQFLAVYNVADGMPVRKKPDIFRPALAILMQAATDQPLLALQAAQPGVITIDDDGAILRHEGEHFRFGPENLSLIHI